NSVYRFDGDNWLYFGDFPNLKDLAANGNTLSITRIGSVVNFDENFNNTGTVNFGEDLNTGLKVGNVTYGGSMLLGLLDGANSIYPDGPYNNQSWSVTVSKGELW